MIDRPSIKKLLEVSIIGTTGGLLLIAGAHPLVSDNQFLPAGRDFQVVTLPQHNRKFLLSEIFFL